MESLKQYHISLSKQLYLKHYQLEKFEEQLRRQVANLVDEAPEIFRPMEMCLYKDSEFLTLANESKTRVFVGLSVAEHVREAI